MDERDAEWGAVCRVARLLSGFDRPWFVAGGWAIDLYLGERTRPHSDVEVAVFRGDQLALRAHLRGWTFEKVVEGERRPWGDGEFLEPPVHEVHAHPPDPGPGPDLDPDADPGPDHDPAPNSDPDPPSDPNPDPPGGPDELEVLLNEVDGDSWVFRRDPRITRDRAEVGMASDDGIPFLAPEVVLLYKAPVFGPYDRRDFGNAVGELDPGRRAWLRRSLRTVAPEHSWLESL